MERDLQHINVNQEHDRKTTLAQRIADQIAAYSGSMQFLLFNGAGFALWIVINVIGPTTIHYDPYPFQFLTMAVSLEAIFLSIFVLISQNRQAAKDRIAAENDYAVNVLAEKNIEQMINHLDSQDHELLKQTNYLIQLIEKLEQHRKEDHHEM